MTLDSPNVLTPVEVGEPLGLSRSFIARLLDEGTIPSEYLPGGRHRVVRSADVLEFSAGREKRRAGRRRIAEGVESVGLPY
ncbi:helix-turn-helix transcriptional regulator [Nocardiopsis sp. LOL_012]|uniref:helix-turn-helix transcriptional regulator n=1 Tax=Nocardiopsis sp. LOL_012 TaxID=3345409 RepID=UPI003A8AB9F6